jgi:hypothetical protein
MLAKAKAIFESQRSNPKQADLTILGFIVDSNLFGTVQPRGPLSRPPLPDYILRRDDSSLQLKQTYRAIKSTLISVLHSDY